jgi:hypothetical protein
MRWLIIESWYIKSRGNDTRCPGKRFRFRNIAEYQVLLERDCKAIKNLPNINIILVNEATEYRGSCKEGR